MLPRRIFKVRSISMQIRRHRARCYCDACTRHHSARTLCLLVSVSANRNNTPADSSEHYSIGHVCFPQKAGNGFKSGSAAIFCISVSISSMPKSAASQRSADSREIILFVVTTPAA